MDYLSSDDPVDVSDLILSPLYFGFGQFGDEEQHPQQHPFDHLVVVEAPTEFKSWSEVRHWYPVRAYPTRNSTKCEQRIFEVMKEKFPRVEMLVQAIRSMTISAELNVTCRSLVSSYETQLKFVLREAIQNKQKKAPAFLMAPLRHFSILLHELVNKARLEHIYDLEQYTDIIETIVPSSFVHYWKKFKIVKEGVDSGEMNFTVTWKEEEHEFVIKQTILRR